MAGIVSAGIVAGVAEVCGHFYVRGEGVAYPQQFKRRQSPQITQADYSAVIRTNNSQETAHGQC
jgi:hypothetical protein